MNARATSSSKLGIQVIAILLACVITCGLLIGCGGSSSDGGSTSSDVVSSTSSESAASEESDDNEMTESTASGEANSEAAEKTAASEEESKKATIDPTEQLRKALDEKIDGHITFNSSVRNDKTGNWRLARVATSSPITDYAKEYYEAYFTDDGEVHAVINFTTKETNNITVGMGMLFIDTHQYVDGEEHDAAELFNGPVTAQYIVDLNTGEVETL